MTRRLPLSFALFFLAHVGCDQVTDPIQLGLPGGRIEGTVRTGAIPTDMLVLATRVDGPHELLVKADVAADGSYGVDVPAGRYVVSLGSESGRIVYDYSQDGPLYGNGPPDRNADARTHAHAHTSAHPRAHARARSSQHRSREGVRHPLGIGLHGLWRQF